MPLLRRMLPSRPLAAGLTAVALAFLWQALTVHYNYGGNWTALFCTGEKVRVPPQLSREGIYLFRASDGYDGQFYHYIAHDPFLRKGYVEYMDDARLRYRRILVPALAYLLAAGRDRYVDTALFAVVWLFVFLGAFWLSRYAVLHGRHPAWGMGFLLVPAVIVSIDRIVIDIALAALVAGFAVYARQGVPMAPRAAQRDEAAPGRCRACPAPTEGVFNGAGWRLYVVLACACLTRESGILLAGSYCVYLLWKRLPLKACLFATSALPLLAWSRYVQARTLTDLLGRMAKAPVSKFLRLRVLRMARYDLPDPAASILHVMDWLLLAGVVLAMVLALRSLLRRSRDHGAFAGLAFALVMAMTMIVATMRDPFTQARLASPLLLLVAMEGLRDGWRLGWAPLALVTLRAAAQLAPQALGVVRGLLGK